MANITPTQTPITPVSTPAPVLDQSQFYTDPTSGTTYTSKDVAKQYGVNIPTVDSLGTQTPLDIKSTLPTAGPDVAGATVAGANTTTKTLADYIKELTPPKTDTQIQADSLSSDISKLLGQDTGKVQAQSDAEAAAGVNDLKKSLTDINSQILTKSAQYDATSTKLEGQSIPMSLIIGQQAQVQKAKASEIGLLQARALGLQGQIQFAQETANKAVDLKYSVIEDQLNTKQKQLALLGPTLTKEEQVTADALKRQYDDQQKQIQDKKDKEKANITAALNAKIQTRFTNNKGEFFDTLTGEAFPDAPSFFKAAGVTSFEDAYAKKLVSDLTSTADYSKYPASYQEYQLAKQEGFKGTYNDYQTMDANRKRSLSVTNNITPEEKVVDKFNTKLTGWDKAGTREQFIRELQSAFPNIEPVDIQKKVYETYPNGYDSTGSNGKT